MSEPIVLTANEAQVIDLLRQIKAYKGHGQITVEVRDGIEVTPLKVTYYAKAAEEPRPARVTPC